MRDGTFLRLPAPPGIPRLQALPTWPALGLPTGTADRCPAVAAGVGQAVPRGALGRGAAIRSEWRGRPNSCLDRALGLAVGPRLSPQIGSSSDRTESESGKERRERIEGRGEEGMTEEGQERSSGGEERNGQGLQ